MAKIHRLIDTIIRLKKIPQSRISEISSVHPSNLSKYLSGETDIRSSSLIKILLAVEVNLEDILEREMNLLLGKVERENSLGEALETLMKESDPIMARTLLENLFTRTKNRNNKLIRQALGVVKDFKAKLITVRRT